MCNIFTDHKSLKYIFTQSEMNMRQRRRPLEFQVGDYVYLKVTPMKKKRFGIKKKLAARFVGPYKIIEKKGPMAYKL